MSTPRNGPVAGSMDDWMRGQEKRVMREERRPRISSASDLLGPGFGPTATELTDWNAEEARFNGFFYSAGDAENVPLPGYYWWMGLAISTGNHTLQIVWSHGPGETMVFQRQVHVHDNQMPSFAPWEPLGGGVDGATLLDELLDVAIASVDEGDYLRYTSGEWVNAALSKADIADFAHTHDDRYYTESETDFLLESKSDTTHTHDERYYTESEVDSALAGKSDTAHNHDSRYYTETETDSLLAGKSSTGHTHDDRYFTEAEVTSALAGKSNTGHTHTKADITDFAHTHTLNDLTAGVLGVPLTMAEQGPPPTPAAGTGVWWTGTDSRPHFKNDAGEEIVLDQVEGHVPTTAPTSSPGVQVIGFAEGLIVQSEPVPQSTLIEYHISDDSAFAPTPGDTATVAFPEMTRDQIVVIRALADGTPLSLNTPYYVRTFAWNPLGYAPTPGAVDGDELDPTMVSRIVTDELAARQVTAAKVVVGNSYWDSTGLYIATPNGTISFPATGAAAEIIGVALTAFSLTVTGDTTFQGLVSLRNTATMTAGLSDPSTAPAVSSNYPTLEAEMPVGSSSSEGPYYWSGLCDSVAGTHWVSHAYPGTTNGGSTNDIALIHKTTGVVTLDKITLADGVTPLSGSAKGGITRIGTKYFLLFYDTTISGWAILKIDDQFRVESSTAYTMPTGVNMSSAHKLGTDGTHLLIIGATLSPFDMWIRHFDVSGTPAPVAGQDWKIATADTDNSIWMVLGGNFDYGAYRYVVLQGNGVAPRVFAKPGSGTTLVRQSASSEWPMPPTSSSNQPGIWWDGTRFWTLTSEGNIVKHSTSMVESIAHLYTYDYTDGTNQTGLSPIKAFTDQVKRGWCRVEVTPPPDNPANLYARIYDSSERQTTVLHEPAAIGRTIHFVEKFQDSNVTNPGNTFTTGNLGKLAATNDGFWVDGNSDGDIGIGSLRDSIRRPLRATQHRCKLIRTTNMTGIPHATTTPVVWQSEAEDVGGLGDVANSRIVIQRDGIYNIRGGALVDPSLENGKSYAAMIRLDANTVIAGNREAGTGAVNNPLRNLAATAPGVYLTAGQTVELCVFHNRGSGVTMEVSSSTGSNNHWGTFLEVSEVI